MIKVAVIGLGHLGKWHLDKVLACDEAELACVVDPSASAQEMINEKKLSVPLFTRVEDCLDLFDAAFVVTPTSFHFEICKTLLKSNKHIFCEKPMTSTHEQAVELKSLSTENGKVFQVGHSERFHAIWSQLAQQSAYLEGAPILSLNRQAPFKGRATDVDVVQDLMIHDIDLILFLLKEKPVTVLAVGKKQRTDKWDFVKALFTFESGAQATLTVGRNHVCEVREVESVNEKGCLRIDLLNRQVLEASSSSQSSEVNKYEYDKRDHLLEEHRCFYNSILGKREDVVVPMEAGIEAVYFVQKVLDSLEMGKMLIC